MSKLILWIFFTIFIFSSECQNPTMIKENLPLCTTDNYEMPLYSTQNLSMTFNQTRLKQLNIHTIRIHTSIADEKVANFENNLYTIDKIISVMNDSNNHSSIIYDFQVYGKFIDKTYINYYIEMINQENRIYQRNCSRSLLISGPKRIIDKLFQLSIPCIIILTSFQMGILLDIEVLKELIRRPIPALIGFICQFGFMPTIAFIISKVFDYKPIYGLGLFVVGCCPGSFQSNQWAIVFDGDLNLSVFMSFVSTVASFFMMPLWLYTLGQYAYLRDLKIRIPFFNLMTSLLTIIIPVGLGMLLVHFVPRLKIIMARIIKPLLVFLLIYFFTFAFIVHYYLIFYLDLKTIISAPFLPWCGFLLGGLFAWICKQDWKRVITIGIETGVQNIGIALMVFYYTFPSPEKSQASTIPITVVYLSVQPLLIILFYRIIRKKCCHKKKQKSSHHKSLDTLSKTTRNVSEPEEESIPMSILSPNSAVSKSNEIEK